MLCNEGFLSKLKDQNRWKHKEQPTLPVVPYIFNTTPKSQYFATMYKMELNTVLVRFGKLCGLFGKHLWTVWEALVDFQHNIWMSDSIV